eukprot:s2435_g7.t1
MGDLSERMQQEWQTGVTRGQVPTEQKAKKKSQAVVVEPPMMSFLEDQIEENFRLGNSNWRRLLGSWLVAQSCLRRLDRPRQVQSSDAPPVPRCSLHSISSGEDCAIAQMAEFEAWEVIPRSALNEADDLAQQEVDKKIQQDLTVLWALPPDAVQLQAHFRLSEELTTAAKKKRSSEQRAAAGDPMPAEIKGYVLMGAPRP